MLKYNKFYQQKTSFNTTSSHETESDDLELKSREDTKLKQSVPSWQAME